MKTKYLLLTLFLLLVAIGISLFFIYGKSWAEQKLEKKLSEIEQLSYDSLIIDLDVNEVTFKSLQYNSDGININIQNVSIQDISAFKVLLQNTLHINQLTLDSVKINYTPTSKTESQNEDSSPAISELPIKIQIERTELLNAVFNYFDEVDEKPTIESKLELTILDVEIHELKELTELLQLVEAFEVVDFKYRSKSGRYHVEAQAFHFSKEENSLLVKGPRILPQYAKYQFASVVGHEIDWINASIDSIYIEMQSLDSFIRHKRIDKLFIHQPQLAIFRDKRLPFPEHNRPKLLKELLASETVSFGVDSIFIINGNIAYEEHVKEANQPGKVTFDDLNGELVNLYTFNKNNEHRPRLTAQCKLFNATTLYADISFPTKINEPTIVKGVVEPTDLSVFNQMLEHVAFARIKSGQMNELNFNFTYGTKDAEGEMMFDYTDLQIAFLQKEKSKASGLFNEVKEFVANTFVVNSNNGKNGKIRVGKIAYERNIEKSMFNFWWKSILTGFKSSTGITSPEEKKKTTD